jgi:flagellin-like hook-associated protein FlgL
MHGNALEWTDTVQNGRFILGSGAYYSQPHEITSSSRYWAPSSSSAYRGVGFRLALKKKSSDTPAINSNDRITAANEERKNVLKLTDFQSSYFDQAIENISYLRSVTSATSSRLQLTHDLSQQVNFSSNNAFSKIVDVDYAAESTHLAKQKIMKNASTAMIAQANGLAEIALIFLN